MTAGTQMCTTTVMLSRIESSIAVQYRKARVHEWNGPCYQTWNNRKTNVKHFENVYNTEVYWDDILIPQKVVLLHVRRKSTLKRYLEN
jgi:hypothetical protein